jgi:transcriptional regulator with XRE-family HTH domain
MSHLDATPTFGMLLREHRLTADLTQAMLADRARLSVRGIQHLERGETRPYPNTVQQLAEALALSPDERAELEAAATPAPRRRQAAPDADAPSTARLEPTPIRSAAPAPTVRARFDADPTRGLARTSHPTPLHPTASVEECLALLAQALSPYGGSVSRFQKGERGGVFVQLAFATGPREPSVHHVARCASRRSRRFRAPPPPLGPSAAPAVYRSS